MAVVDFKESAHGKSIDSQAVADAYTIGQVNLRLCHDEAHDAPIPMRLVCPACGELHVDEGDFATKPHHTHACQECGNVWRPAIVNTVGVRFLPGFKNG
jgi:predicted RNA-binding Zn-ribbon protein involved in translation (DUF1610 family)